MVNNTDFFSTFCFWFLFVPAELEIYILSPFLGARRSFCGFPFILFISSKQSCLFKKKFLACTKFCLHSCIHDSASVWASLINLSSACFWGSPLKTWLTQLGSLWKPKVKKQKPSTVPPISESVMNPLWQVLVLWGSNG